MKSSQLFFVKIPVFILFFYLGKKEDEFEE
jgi:hypothetical protein